MYIKKVIANSISFSNHITFQITGGKPIYYRGINSVFLNTHSFHSLTSVRALKSFCILVYFASREPDLQVEAERLYFVLFLTHLSRHPPPLRVSSSFLKWTSRARLPSANTHDHFPVTLDNGRFRLEPLIGLTLATFASAPRLVDCFLKLGFYRVWLAPKQSVYYPPCLP